MKLIITYDDELQRELQGKVGFGYEATGEDANTFSIKVGRKVEKVRKSCFSAHARYRGEAVIVSSFQGDSCTICARGNTRNVHRSEITIL